MSSFVVLLLSDGYGIVVCVGTKRNTGLRTLGGLKRQNAIIVMMYDSAAADVTSRNRVRNR